MEYKKMLNDEELYKVVGGEGLERNVVTAFSMAELRFRSIGEAASSLEVANKSEVCNAAYGMAGICSRVVSGGVSVADAMNLLQKCYDDMTNPLLALQRTFSDLKNAIGW